MLIKHVDGLQIFQTQAEWLDIDTNDIEILYRMFILLYADDTVIFAETPESLQSAITLL